MKEWAVSILIHISGIVCTGKKHNNRGKQKKRRLQDSCTHCFTVCQMSARKHEIVVCVVQSKKNDDNEMISEE